MNKQYLLIHNYPALFAILSELKHLLSFELKEIKNSAELKKNLNSSELIISNNNLKVENQIPLNELPLEFGKLVDFLNISFLQKKIQFQKDIKIGKYLFNFNSRKIFKKEKHLNLTEKEAMIIDFLDKFNGSVSVQNLQKNVWGYRSQLETHTVETHVYRLRKKILDIFEDSNFIVSDKKGYKLKTT
tara:strand:+ start:336 stop:896 length:561 start_codon:yes stop_codon:yes gene_type:complete